jgi:hypothetical protein
MISYWLAQFLSRDNKTSARNKKILFQQPKKPWKKDSTRCLHLSTRVNGYLKLFYFEQATVIANRVGYADFFFFFPPLFLHVSLEMLQHQYIDVNSEVDNATTTTLERGRSAKPSHDELGTLIHLLLRRVIRKILAKTKQQISAVFITCLHCIMTPIHQSCNNVTCLIPTRSAHN